MSNSISNKKYMYVVVVILCCLSILGTLGVPNAYSLFYTPMAQALGVGRAAIVFHTTISSLVYGFCVPLTPTLIRKFSIKRLFVAGLFMQLVICVLIAMSKTVLLIDILSVFKGISSIFLSTILLTTVINNWFVKYRGTVIGIVFSFSGIGGALASQVFQYLLNGAGYQIAYIVMGIATFVFAIPFALICPEKPSRVGLKPLGEGEEIKAEKKISYNYPLVLKSKLFITVDLLMVCITTLVCLSSHLTSYALDKGFPSEVSANVLSMIMIGNVLFKFVMGILIDKFGVIVSSATMMAASALSIVLFLVNNTNATLFSLTGILYGAGYGLCSVGIPSIISHYYDGENYAKAYSSTTFTTSIYSAIVLSLVGMAYDKFGSFNIPFIFLLVIGSVGFIFISLLYKNVDKKEEINK